MTLTETLSLFQITSLKNCRGKRKLEKYGATPVKAIARIKRSFEIAMSDTDNRLLTQTNVKTSTRSKKTMTPEEAKKLLEVEAAKVAESK